ncbi:MAG TPA: hypothetical protein VNY30_14350 [Bryobacteraceae bacterium]|jgi:hypothetical protein|nr:hypothetical protein [Bryobacteraceae bacterium]
MKLDLRQHRRLWEDIYDTWIAERRKAEPRVAWKDVQRRLKRLANDARGR